MRRLLPLLPLAVAGLLVVLFATYGLHHDPQVQPNALIGKPLPAEALPPLHGGAPAPIAAALGGPGLVNVFGSWCTSCILEAPQLMKLKAAGVRVIGVTWMDKPADTQTFLDRYGDPFDRILVGNDNSAIDLGITGAPETFIVDAKGMVVGKRVGPVTDADIPVLAQQIARLRQAS